MLVGARRKATGVPVAVGVGRGGAAAGPGSAVGGLHLCLLLGYSQRPSGATSL